MALLEVNVIPGGLHNVPLLVMLGKTANVTSMGKVAVPPQLLTVTEPRLVAFPCHKIRTGFEPCPLIIVPKLLEFPAPSTIAQV